MNLYDPLTWNDSLLTGVDEIDRQHRSLIDIINEANAKLADNPSKQLVADTIFDLLAYAAYHFETEERLMSKHGYASECPVEAETHRSEHRAFAAKVKEVRAELQRGVWITREDLLTFLNQWVVNHVLTIDKHLGQFISSKQNG